MYTYLDHDPLPIPYHFPAIASSSLDSSLRFWKTESGQLLNQVALGPVDLWTVTFSPCDKYVVSGSQEGKITLYNVETGKEDRVLDPQNGKFTLSIAYVSGLLRLIRYHLISFHFTSIAESRWQIHCQRSH